MNINLLENGDVMRGKEFIGSVDSDGDIRAESDDLTNEIAEAVKETWNNRGASNWPRVQDWPACFLKCLMAMGVETRNRFRIVANGSDMGIYYADDEAEAVLRYVGEAGYHTIEEAAKVCGQSVEAFRKDIQVSEVEE